MTTSAKSAFGDREADKFSAEGRFQLKGFDFNGEDALAIIYYDNPESISEVTGANLRFNDIELALLADICNDSAEKAYLASIHDALTALDNAYLGIVSVRDLAGDIHADPDYYVSDGRIQKYFEQFKEKLWDLYSERYKASLERAGFSQAAKSSGPVPG